MPNNAITVPHTEDYGPAMRALNERQRIFVEEMMQQNATGTLNYAEAARAAGYSDPGTSNSCAVQGHRLAHSEKIQAAMLEEGVRRFGASIPVATATIIQILQDPLAKRGEKMKAAAMIFNRTGMPETTEHRVSVKRELSEEEKVEKAISLAKSLGLDPKALLGSAGIRSPKSHFPASDIRDSEEAEVVATTEGLEDFL